LQSHAAITLSRSDRQAGTGGKCAPTRHGYHRRLLPAASPTRPAARAVL